MAKLFRGFSMTQVAARALDDPRMIKSFVETLLVQSNNFVDVQFDTAMSTINDRVKQEFGHEISITAMDVETGDAADEFSDVLLFQIDVDVPSKRLH